MNRFGPPLGAEKTGASVYDVTPGQSICPYHYEYPEEEWVLVLTGEVVLRHPGGEDALAAGEIVCFPEGPDGAHKLTNRTDEPARVLMFSTVNSTNVSVYPDSDKFYFSTGVDRDKGIVRRADANAGYWEHEPLP